MLQVLSRMLQVKFVDESVMTFDKKLNIVQIR